MIKEPKYSIDDVLLTQGEALWLINARITHANAARGRIDRVAYAVADVNEELVDLAAERDALPPGAERDATTTQLDVIDLGMTERVKLSAKAVRKALRNPPTPNDARRETIRAVYNHSGGVLRGNPTPQNTHTRQTSGLPKFIFDAIDLNLNGEATVIEFSVYWLSLNA